MTAELVLVAEELPSRLVDAALSPIHRPRAPVPFVAYSEQGPDHYYGAPALKQFDGAGKLHVEVTQQYGTKVR